MILWDSIPNKVHYLQESYCQNLVLQLEISGTRILLLWQCEAISTTLRYFYINLYVVVVVVIPSLPKALVSIHSYYWVSVFQKKKKSPRSDNRRFSTVPLSPDCDFANSDRFWKLHMKVDSKFISTFFISHTQKNAKWHIKVDSKFISRFVISEMLNLAIFFPNLSKIPDARSQQKPIINSIYKRIIKFKTFHYLSCTTLLTVKAVST